MNIEEAINWLEKAQVILARQAQEESIIAGRSERNESLQYHMAIQCILEEYEKQLDLDYVDKNYISKDKLKFILSKLNISDIEPWSTYKIDGQILFDLQELL